MRSSSSRNVRISSAEKMRRISETKAGNSAAKSVSSSEALDKAEDFFSDQIMQRVFQSKVFADSFSSLALFNPDFVELYRGTAHG